MAVPVTTSNISTSWCTGFFAVIFETSELSQTYFTLDGSNPTTSPTRLLFTSPFIIDANGITTVKFYSISNSTHQANAIQTQHVKIDGAAPVSVMHVNIQPDGQNGWYVTLPVITITATDLVSGVLATYYSWDGGSFQQYTGGPLSFSSEGIHYLQVYSVDNAGNKEAVQTNVFKYDHSAPSTAITTPQGVSHQPVTITFSATDGASGQRATYYTTDGSTPTTDLTPANSFEIKESGLYVVKFFSVDNAGNAESVKVSDSFRVEINQAALQVLITESFPINGHNGWYKSSPQIGLLTTKPDLITELQYKIAPRAKPTTATYTSTVHITGQIDLSGGSFIALEIDQSSTPLVINIRGVDATKTTITDIIDQINNTVGGDIPVAAETGSDGLVGTGYITVTSPTGGTGSPTSEIKFVSPGTFDATETVFGLSIDAYPHAFTETYLYVNYTGLFVLPGDGSWEVAAIAKIGVIEQATVKKNYNLDSHPPVTQISVAPDHAGFYTSSPDITFLATDQASGVDKIIYQFDNDPTLEYHLEDGPIHLPDTSRRIRLRYFSVDIAGNEESPQERDFDFDDVKPTTVIDGLSVGAYNTYLSIICSWAHVVEYDPGTHEYEFTLLTPSLRDNLVTFNRPGYSNPWSAAMAYLNSLHVDSIVKQFTVDIANEYLVTLIPHNLSTGNVVQVNSTVQLPDPLLNNRYYYAIVISSTQIRVADTYDDALNNVYIDITNAGIGTLTLNRAKPELIVSNMIRLFLMPTDDWQYQVVDEIIALKDASKRELTTNHNYVTDNAGTVHIYNDTTHATLNFKYISGNHIYTLQPFADTDVIRISYTYSSISHVYYAVNGDPSTLTPEGVEIDLLDNGVHTVKWFAVDGAGNTEDTKDVGATIVVLNRAPAIDVQIVKSADQTSFEPNGDDQWYRLDESVPSLRPMLRMDIESADAFIFNAAPSLVSVSPIVYRLPQVDPAYEEISAVSRVENITRHEVYAVQSFVSNTVTVTGTSNPAGTVFTTNFAVEPENLTVASTDLDVNDIVNLTTTGTLPNWLIPTNVNHRENYYIVSKTGSSPNIKLKLSSILGGPPISLESDGTGIHTIICVVEVDCKYRTLFDTNPASYSKRVKIGDVHAPDFDVSFSDKPNPYYYPELPATYDIQGSKDITVIAVDLRGRTTTNTSISQLHDNNTLKLDTHAPTSVDNAFSGWVNHDVMVNISASDYNPPPLYHQSASGINRILYSTDGTDPGISFSGLTVDVSLTVTGQYIVKHRAVDNAGNYEAIQESLPVQIDKTAPVTTVIVVPPDGTNGWYKTSPIITLDAQDPNSGINSTYYTWDHDLFALYSGTLTIPSQGIHTLYFYSEDNVGNVEVVEQCIFKFDPAIPVTTDNITDDWTNNRIVQLTVQAGPSGVARTYYEFAIDPIIPPDPTTGSLYTTTSGIPFPASSIYNLKYFSVNNAGDVESVKVASHELQLDLERPSIVSIIPANLVFTNPSQYLVVNLTDALSGVDVDAVRVLVDDVEYSTAKNSSYFSFVGVFPYNVLQVRVGPVGSLPGFQNLENVVVYAKDYAGNGAIPVVAGVLTPDTVPPYIRGFWPRNKADDVSRDTNVMMFIDDDISGVDLRTVRIKVANSTYQVTTTDVMVVTYSGTAHDVFIDILDNNMYVTVGGVVVATANLTHDQYSTVKKISEFLDSIPDFDAVMISKDYDQIPSLEFINLFHVPVSPTVTLFVARFEENKNIYFVPRNRGYLLAVTPFETFEDGYVVNVSVDAADFSGNVMSTERYYFTCRDAVTPSRSFRNKWYNYHIDIINRILSRLESTYNKNSESTVFYGYFRSLALEIARSMQVSEDYTNDNYYAQTRSELLYQNLGYLLKFEPRTDLSHDRYREVLLTLMQMFFKGSTRESLVDGLSVLLGVQSVSIREYLDNIAWQFMFSFDVDVGSQPIRNWDAFNANVNEVLKLVKPAHTYFLLRYVFSEIVRTQDIRDEIVRWDFAFNGSENVRINCADKYRKAEIITEDVTSQFDGTNNCCTVYFKPILNWAETDITNDPTDVQVEVLPPGPPISVISVNGITGRVCLSRNPLTTESVKIIYKFNKYVIYRELRLYLNTYTITAGQFDLTQKALLNQVNVPSDTIIAYNIPEQSHAHMCETGIFIDVNYGTLEERWKGPDERLFFNVSDFYAERVELDIHERVDFGALVNETLEAPDEAMRALFVVPYRERVGTISGGDYGFAHETNAHPFMTNDPDSLTNDITDMLFFWIGRIFGG